MAGMWDICKAEKSKYISYSILYYEQGCVSPGLMSHSVMYGTRSTVRQFPAGSISDYLGDHRYSM